MINLLLTYKLASKTERDSFLSELKENNIDTISQSEHGCSKYCYFLPCDSDTELTLIEIWETAEDQQLHCTQPHFKIVQELKSKYEVETICEKL